MFIYRQFAKIKCMLLLLGLILHIVPAISVYPHQVMKTYGKSNTSNSLISTPEQKEDVMNTVLIGLNVPNQPVRYSKQCIVKSR